MVVHCESCHRKLETRCLMADDGRKQFESRERGWFTVEGSLNGKPVTIFACPSCKDTMLKPVTEIVGS